MNQALQKAREAKEAMRAAGVKVIKTSPIEKASANPQSKALAIKAKCCECMGGPEERNWQKAIRDCQSQLCPLHPVRPYQNLGKEGQEREELA